MLRHSYQTKKLQFPHNEITRRDQLLPFYLKELFRAETKPHPNRELPDILKRTSTF